MVVVNLEENGHPPARLFAQDEIITMFSIKRRSVSTNMEKKLLPLAKEAQSGSCI